MKLSAPRRPGRAALRRFAAPAAAVAILVGGGAAVTQSAQATTGHGHGRGVDEFGMTMGAYHGRTSSFTYTKGFFCDTSIASAATTGCEVGEDAKVAPSKWTEPLYITVPLGFTPKKTPDCPAGLVCVDHPMTMDLTRLAPALAPLYKTTPEKLMPALKNFSTPGHDHFITDRAGGKAIWWDVQVVGVTDPTVYKNIQAHHSFRYVKSLMDAKNPNVLGPIPTNLYLFFAAK